MRDDTKALDLTQVILHPDMHLMIVLSLSAEAGNEGAMCDSSREVVCRICLDIDVVNSDIL